MAKDMNPTPPHGTPGSTDAPGGASAARGASRWPKRWLALAIAIATTGLAYGIGRVQGAMALRQEEQRSANERAAWQTSLAACSTDRSLLEARRSLALVALSLDRRNFGVAESHRQRALEALGQPSLSSVPEASKLAGGVRGLDLGVDPDPGTKRGQVIAVSEALDRLLTERASTPPKREATATKSVDASRGPQ